MRSNPAIPLLGICHPDKTIIQKDTCYPNVYCSTIYNMGSNLDVHHSENLKFPVSMTSESWRLEYKSLH